GIGLLVLGRGDQVPVRGGDVLHPPHPDRVVDVPVDVDVLRPGGEAHGIGRATHRDLLAGTQLSVPICQRIKANSSAVSCSDWKRPDLPPWPAPMLVLSSSSLP